jgi:hypothetical protein
MDTQLQQRLKCSYNRIYRWWEWMAHSYVAIETSN